MLWVFSDIIVQDLVQHFGGPVHHKYLIAETHFLC